MAKIKKRKQEARRQFWAAFKETLCPNCGQSGKHYVVPSMGEDGFFICQAFPAPAASPGPCHPAPA